MEMRQLEYFVKVADAASFSKAAVILRMAQSTLSRQIGVLEQEVGQRLLLRTGHGATPTAAGIALLEHARAILAIAEHARQELLDLDAMPRGRVTVGLPSLVAQQHGAQLVEEFTLRFPKAMLTIVEGMSLQLREWLVDGRLDIAVLYDPLPVPQLTYIALGSESLALIGSTRAPRLPVGVPVQTLPRYPLVLARAPNAIRTLIDRVIDPRNIDLHVIAEVGSAHTMLAMVSEGVGYTILPESASRILLGRGLQYSRLSAPAIFNNRQLAMPTSRSSTRLIRETAAILRLLNERREDKQLSNG
jgi:LysR family nitrogen assimilation transcriptional regulator